MMHAYRKKLLCSTHNSSILVKAWHPRYADRSKFSLFIHTSTEITHYLFQVELYSPFNIEISVTVVKFYSKNKPLSYRSRLLECQRIWG
jgi:hypothetical protein